MQANEHLYPTSPSLVIVLTNQIPGTAIVDLWSFVERFSKKLETYYMYMIINLQILLEIPDPNDLFDLLLNAVL